MGQFRRALENLTYNQMWFVAILIPMTSLAPIMYYYCDSFINERVLERPDYDNATWADLILLLYFVPIIYVAKYIVRKLSTSYFENRLSAKYSGEVLELKIQK